MRLFKQSDIGKLVCLELKPEYDSTLSGTGIPVYIYGKVLSVREQGVHVVSYIPFHSKVLRRTEFVPYDMITRRRFLNLGVPQLRRRLLAQE
ncbi:MAG: hypothetical protein V1659_05255 [Candidatus Woesearchaeota archaeon]